MLDADVLLFKSGLSVSRSYSDSAVSKAPTWQCEAVALVEGDYRCLAMIICSTTVQALDISLDVRALAGELPVSRLGLHLWSVLSGWGLTLAEGCTGAKGTPLSMWQVRVWWTDWMEIASGPESMFMSSCQSTDRPVWPVSQAQVWSRHPQSRRLALDYHHHITHYCKKDTVNHKKYGKGNCLCANYHLQCVTFWDEDFRVSDKVISRGSFYLMWNKYHLLDKWFKSSGLWELVCVTLGLCR